MIFNRIEKKTWRAINAETSIHKVLLFCFLVLPILVNSPSVAEELKTGKQIPPLEETLQLVLKRLDSPSDSSNWIARIRQMFTTKNPSVAEIKYQVKQHYYQIQIKKEQLSIAEEVQEHFEEAISKAEEKYADEESEEDITQSDITKLKLGLAGTSNDITEIKSDMALAKLSLGKMMGWDLSSEIQLAQDKILPVEFDYTNLREYRLKAGKNSSEAAGLSEEEKRFALQKTFIRINKTREKKNLANKIKKITRALLVTELANYDFGIGDSGDLFQALIIYTKVLRGYYESIYNFNMAVAALEKIEN